MFTLKFPTAALIRVPSKQYSSVWFSTERYDIICFLIFKSRGWVLTVLFFGHPSVWVPSTLIWHLKGGAKHAAGNEEQTQYPTLLKIPSTTRVKNQGCFCFQRKVLHSSSSVNLLTGYTVSCCYEFMVLRQLISAGMYLTYQVRVQLAVEMHAKTGFTIPRSTTLNRTVLILRYMV